MEGGTNVEPSELILKQYMKRLNNYIPMYIQQDATLHSLFILETALNVSGGNSTHHQERTQLYLQHLVPVKPLLIPAAIVAVSSNGLTGIRCCRYSCVCS